MHRSHYCLLTSQLFVLLNSTLAHWLRMLTANVVVIEHLWLKKLRQPRSLSRPAVTCCRNQPKSPKCHQLFQKAGHKLSDHLTVSTSFPCAGAFNSGDGHGGRRRGERGGRPTPASLPPPVAVLGWTAEAQLGGDLNPKSP